MVVVVDLDGGGAAGLEAEIDIEDAQEAVKEEACTDEKNAGEGDLGDDEDGTQALVLAAFAGSVTAVFEGSPGSGCWTS